MIRKEDLSYQFIKKEPLSGSCSGMRYYLTMEKDCIRACTYPDRFCFVKTPEEEKVYREFPASPDSMPLILDWLNECLSDIQKAKDDASR
ncbi:MAG TPA: GNAT family acetyltransferase [Candidatus Eisenbergiella merdavium]|uniref:GNAT family acetyltransferase n=1 Tax=Candidatus Eisenbergiella merdavium TaxID=2838551 RepID=A0A9D2NDR6_9FIRM|nr:GNAT family acetyltransferase [Candidatus Eisenbergiella merdavium]